MNKDFFIIPEEVLKSRLSFLFKTLNENYNSSSMLLEEEAVSLYHSAIDLFFKSIDKSATGTLNKFKPGFPSDPVEYNQFTDAILTDLSILFLEMASLSKLLSSSFNAITCRYDQISKSSDQISNKIGDYLLYATPSLGAGFFFGDSFETSNKLEINSSLLEGDECFHAIEEGSLLLPLDGSPDRPSIDKIIINSPSNGVSGNNYQISSSGHNQIDSISDNQPNTWFEYETVSSSELSSSLILDLTIKLKEISPVNYIEVIPINFGTATPISIKLIETSKDGVNYSSIKDEVPIKDYLSEEEENIFILSGKGSGFYSFLVRKAQFVHIRFEQATPYPVSTINGERLRYAIGIKDINIYSRKFKSSGSIISSPFSSNKEIKKVSLLASENPLEISTLANIDHYISVDSGGTWIQLQPQNRDSSNEKEIINFNTSDINSVSTGTEVTSLKHKISMSRDTDSFEGNVVIKEERLNKIDVLSTSFDSKNRISLSQKPIKKTISLLAPYNGSYSCPRDNNGSSVAEKSFIFDLDVLDFNIDAVTSSVDSLIKYPLPYKNIINLEEHLRVFVNGSQIEYCPKLLTAFSSNGPTSYSEVDSDSKVYFLNNNGQELQFGFKDENGVMRGFCPPTGTKVSVCLDGDNPLVELTDSGYVLNLSSFSDGNKDKVNLYANTLFDNEDYFDYEIEVPSGVRIFKEDSEHISFVFLSGISNFSLKEYNMEGDLLAASSMRYTTPVEYKSGLLDVTGWGNNTYTNRYTFDSDTGTVYLSTPVPNDRKVFLCCKRNSLKKIEAKEWNFFEDTNNRIQTNKIVLSPASVHTIKQEYYIDGSDNLLNISLLSDNKEAHSWSNQGLVKGTVMPSKSLLGNSDPFEVSFINGSSEFNSIVNIDSEITSFIESSIGSNVWEHTLSQVNDTQSLYSSLTFSAVRSIDSRIIPVNNFLITGQVQSSLAVLASTTEGTWAVEDGILYLKLYSTPSVHSIGYKVSKVGAEENLKGAYSVDYKNGVIYFSNLVTDSGSVIFELSSYSAFYNISKKISEENIINIDYDNNSIEFSPYFIMEFLKQDTINKNRPQILTALYKYRKVLTESLSDIEPYFSPICKNVSFRAITADLLEEL